jgi:hypothetical protein
MRLRETSLRMTLSLPIRYLSCYPQNRGGRGCRSQIVCGIVTNSLRDFDNFRYALIHSRFTQETEFSWFSVLEHFFLSAVTASRQCRLNAAVFLQLFRQPVVDLYLYHFWSQIND